ncbi:hypothetical protein NUU61_004303 [Penicillium alfredii]|uniref:Urease accessory protein UreD n=1 Tax=Penicillium alfredii TaxID=1506179 RepID=A0A9W9FKU8_9EURO|nr:uncharacterized protein NUU61_004303 [Penicillium alfredii]KAJ5102081.1 hypothetical protein NUU61_004303 [Penicillium alfredii]
MPHKHKRRHNDDSNYNLPPSLIAKPLPVRDQEGKSKSGKKQAAGDNKKIPNQTATSRRKNAIEDDTPRAFRRLMQFQTTGKRAPSGLETEDKSRENKKRKRDTAATKNESSNKPTRADSQQTPANGTKATKQAMPTILPGEKLSEFAARVDRTLPLSEMTKSTKPGLGKLREGRQTRHEKHLRRLQRGWREDDVKIREREQEEREEREAEMENQLDLWKEWEAEAGAGKAKKKAAGAKNKKNKKNKKGNSAGGSDDGEVPDSGDDDPDPWAKLKKRERAKQTNPFDVAQAPPQLKKPREIFKVRGGAKVDVANVPAAVGSLRRREELAGERRNIVEEYRRLMAEKRQ